MTGSIETETRPTLWGNQEQSHSGSNSSKCAQCENHLSPATTMFLGEDPKGKSHRLRGSMQNLT